MLNLFFEKQEMEKQEDLFSGEMTEAVAPVAIVAVIIIGGIILQEVSVVRE